MKSLHKFAPMLLTACLVGMPAIAAEEALDDKLLMDCEITPRDATIASSAGAYRTGWVASGTNTVTGNVGDLRLAWDDSAPASRRKFSMVWAGYTAASGNQWFIFPDYEGRCMSTLEGHVNAETCSNIDYWYLTMDGTHFVISYNSSGSNAWKVPSDANGTGFVTTGTYNATDTLTTRRRYHWAIYGCKDIYGNGTTPAA